MATDAEIEAVQKVLGEPVTPELSEVAWKVRNHLFISSVISITVVFANLRVNEQSTFLGLRFDGLTDHVLRSALLAILAYITIHFLWLAIDSFMEWRIRATGTRVAFVTAGIFSDGNADYPNDPRQSTLYHWWKQKGQARSVNTETEISDIKQLLTKLDEDARKCYSAGDDAMNIVNGFTPHLNEVKNRLISLEGTLSNTASIISSARIPASLKRFDNWFQLFCRSQNLRWLVIDLIFPLLLSFYAIALLLIHT